MKKDTAFLLLIFGLLMNLFSCGQPTRTSGDKAMADSEDALLTYQNPVFDGNFPDPTAIEAEDGYYYVYGTNSVVGDSLVNLQVMRSPDLVNWEHLGEGLPNAPKWAEKDFWAPHVYFDQESGQYFLYYSGESIDQNMGKCLGVAVSDHPAGPFVDKGSPLLCGEGFTTIDPMLLEDPKTGVKYLYWGSGHQPIKVRQMADNLLEFKEGSQPIDLIYPIQNDEPNNYSKLVEGPWVHFHQGYYYMFYSGDNCCGEYAHYALMVARSTSPTGPFLTLGQSENANTNSVILESSGTWKAPGHNSLITDRNDDIWTLYHAIDQAFPAKGRVMLLDPIEFENGWPHIQGNIPSEDVVTAPITIK